MNEAQAQKTVLGVLLVSGAVIVWGNLKGSGGTRVLPATDWGKWLVGFLILAAALSIGASAAPELFGPLALLIGLAVVMSRVGKG